LRDFIPDFMPHSRVFAPVFQAALMAALAVGLDDNAVAARGPGIDAGVQTAQSASASDTAKPEAAKSEEDQNNVFRLEGRW